MTDLKELRKQERDTGIRARKNQVIEAAFSCFIKNGIENTSIAEIAALACVGEATVYRYFGNKETIAIACGRRFWQQAGRMYECRREDRDYQKQTGLRQVEVLMQDARDFFVQEKEGFAFLHDFDGYLLSHQVDGERLAEYEEAVDCMRPFLCEAIEKGQRDGSVIASAPAVELYYTLAGTVFGLMQKLAGAGMLLKSDGLMTAERKIDLLLQLLLRGLAGE